MAELRFELGAASFTAKFLKLITICQAGCLCRRHTKRMHGLCRLTRRKGEACVQQTLCRPQRDRKALICHRFEIFR
jgi:hypothetical protein